MLLRKPQRESEVAYWFIPQMFPAPLWNSRNWNTCGLLSNGYLKGMIFASPPQTFRGMHMIGNVHFWFVCASGWEEWLILFGSETCEEDTSMSHMNHPQLGSLILSASSAKTRIVEYGFAVRCGSSKPLWESTRTFTSTCAASYNFPGIHKSRRGCSQWLLFCFFSISSACPAFI